MSGWWKSLPNGLPNVVSPPKSGHRRAAKGMEFPWRCNVDTIAMDLKVSWEMSGLSAWPDATTAAHRASHRSSTTGPAITHGSCLVSVRIVRTEFAVPVCRRTTRCWRRSDARTPSACPPRVLSFFPKTHHSNLVSLVVVRHRPSATVSVPLRARLRERKRGPPVWILA